MPTERTRKPIARVISWLLFAAVTPVILVGAVSLALGALVFSLADGEG